MIRNSFFFILFLVVSLVSCGPSSNRAATMTAISWTPMHFPTIAPTSTFAPTPYPTPNLAQRPLVWFAPLPPLSVVEGRPFIGAEDFMSLFAMDAPWPQAAGRIQVFKLYGEWIGDDAWTVHASDDELKQVVADLNRRSIALAMEAGPLKPTDTCGQGIEGFGGGVEIGIRDANRIKASGGALSYVALDEPFAFASLYDGPNACHWTAEKVAREVGLYIQGMRTVFPELMVGDTEPLWQGIDIEDYKNWLSTFRRVNGFDLTFLHMDIDFNRNDWPQAALELETFARGLDIDFGIIYCGIPSAVSDEAWLSIAGEQVKTYELETGGQPDHILFQSWNDHPDRTLPDTEPYTFTGFVNAYFDDKASLGVRTKGPGANVAYHKPVTASRSNQAPPEGAVDGNPGTNWGAGDFAPQWIVIDLGSPYTIAEIRLLTGQSPNGGTTHRILVKGVGVGEDFQVAHSFSGVTVDEQWLTVKFPKPLEAIRYIRVETTASPSWVAWKEIEVIAAE